MSRLRQPLNLQQLAINWVAGVFGVCIFFTVLHIVWLEEERAAIQDALDARAAPESRLQRAARAVCQDNPARAGRAVEPVWTAPGQLQCVAIVQEDGQP